MKRVLILANESERATIACLRALDKLDVEVYLAFLDNKLLNKITFKNYVQNSYLIYDNTNKNRYIESLINIQNKIGDYFLYSFGDQITKWTIESEQLLKSKGIKFKLPSLISFNSMLNKESFMNLANNFGLDIPVEISADKYINQFEFKNKFVIKSKVDMKTNDRILKIPMLIENRKSLLRLKKMDIDLDKHFIQEYINGPSVYYCACYEDGNKEIDFVQQNIVQQPGGKSVIKAIPYKLPKYIVNKIDNMMKELKWQGVMMVELKEYKGRFYAIECNPRFWGPLQLAIDNGVNFPAYVANIQLSDTCNIEKENGYIWLNGYFLGLLYKLQTKTNFQIHKVELNKRINYKDVWFRKDTYNYFFLESMATVAKQIKKFI